LPSTPNTDARLATEAEVHSVAGERKADSISLGYYYDRESQQRGREINYNGERHLLIFGPNGSGKGTRFLIPNLLRGLKDQSVIVIDPKGELAAVTRRHREAMGHEVRIINPFNVLGLGSCGFNPLAGLDPNSDNFFDDAAALGEALIQIQGNDPHWSQSAQALLVGLIMWEKLVRPKIATLETVRAMLTEPEEFETSADPDDQPARKPVAGLRATAAHMCAKGGDIIASLAARFMNDSREIASVRSSADTQTRWLMSPPMCRDMKKNGIDFARLKEVPTTVYIVLPADRLRTHSAWLRLVIVSALRALFKPGGRRTLFLIDEMAALGHLAPLEDAFALVRGYRIQIAAIFQDLSQLKHLYQERWETFVANAGVVFGFSPNDLTTAEWMSKRSGQATQLAAGYSTNSGTTTGPSLSISQGTSLSDQQIARALYLPHELIGMPEGTATIWLAGLAHSAPVYAPAYKQFAECRERADPNPYYPD
jgi:type IV secretion system protein VirD4